ncbi:MAG TPA: GNAT family N-acetyltransferase [Burkholderiaceae bacterium]|nr:GNAT family N-acetyltransferase [Burkholderiaceae bacterium]
MITLTTQRLRLEPCNDSHLEGLFAINRDPDVMRYITGKPDTRDDTQEMIERVKARWIEYGLSWWCFIELATGEIIGAGCIQYLGRDRANPLEIGWRLRKDKWHQGFASEAANCMARHAFETVGANRLCAVCDPENTNSSRVMERLGMRYQGIEHWYDLDLALYSMMRSDWDQRAALG